MLQVKRDFDGKGTAAKEVPFGEAPGFFRALREQGKRIVQCHGTFDLVHPGHIIHFEEAREHGDVLVVTITDERMVNKGPGRPYFNNALRVKALSALACVDFVVVIPFPAAVEAIECVCPHVYCKGREYMDEGTDVTGNIRDDVLTVERLGGEMRYVGSVVFSSTRILNNHFDPVPSSVKDFCRRVAQRFTPQRFRELVDGLAKLKVLVVGDIIFDRYTTVSVQGLTSKNRMLSGRFVADEMQAGGALAVFRHVREFTPHAHLMAYVGKEPWVEGLLREHLPTESDLVQREDVTTIVKQRFVEPVKTGREMNKLFSVNYIDATHPSPEMVERMRSRLESVIGDYDLVIAMDFGHGVHQDPVRLLLEEKSRFLSLNCQTNSNNYGFNIINRRWNRADTFSLDRTELTLACGRKEFNHAEELARLKDYLGAKYAWLTLGEVETIGLNGDEPPCRVPPFESTAVDTIGAGDAFCAVGSLSAAAGLPLDLATFNSQLAGAQAVCIVGNRDCIKKARLLKSGMAMLTF